VSASFGTVAGGEHNTAGGLGATVGGGAVNNATNSMAVVAGGNVNTASGTNATVCGGQQNVASGGYATIGGGLTNAANNGSATVSGGSQNTASGYVSTIAGGNSNQASGQFAFVGGGQNNTAGKNYASIGGGFGNSATGIKATIAGGGRTNDSDANTGNRVSDDFGTVGGGGNNQAGDNAGANPYATVAGGQQNTASGIASAVGGGNINTASGNSAVVTGGSGNLASGFEAGIAGGFSNTASGQYSFVGGGQNNIASGDNSFAAGKNAKADQNGAMIFAAGNVSPWVAFGTNIFEVFASSGATFDFAEPPGTSFVSFHVFAGQLISTSSGAFLTNAGVWTNASDRNLKTNFEAIDPKDVLDKVAAMPIQQWKYKVERDGKKHIGPMAQDFYAAFGLGDDDKHIGTVDESGVALAAIQGLNQKLEDELRQKDARLSAQRRQIELLQQQMQAMMTRVKAVEVNQNRAPRQARLVVASH